MPLRRRIALSTAAVIAVLVFAFAAATLAAVTGHVLAGAASSATIVAQDVRNESFPHGGLLPSFDDLDHYSSPYDARVYLLRDGLLVAHSPNAPGAVPSPTQRGGLVWERGAFRVERAIGHDYVVVVDWPVGEDLRLLRELLLVLILGMVATAGAGALVSRRAVHRVLAPVQAMTAAAVATLDSGVPFAPPHLPDEPDEFTRLAGLLKDIVGQLEERNRRQQRFLAEAAHELRTPLAVLSGNLDLLAGWGGDDPAVRADSADAMQRTVERMRRMVDDLLTLERAPVSVRAGAAVDLGEVATELAEDAAALAPALDVAAERSAARVVALADPDAVRRVAWALLENALAYTPEGGRVRIRVGRERERVWLSVDDNGPGIPESERERVFERFYRSEVTAGRRSGAAGGGLGMGLAIARALAQAMGGTLHMAEAPGGGTRAELRLARAPAPTGERET
jgi:signal transduction histidine kinase